MEILVQKRKDTQAASRFFRKVLGSQAQVPIEITRGFRSDGQAQRFLSVHGQFNNLFRLGRHLLNAANYRIMRQAAFWAWSQIPCSG